MSGEIVLSSRLRSIIYIKKISYANLRSKAPLIKISTNLLHFSHLIECNGFLTADDATSCGFVVESKKSLFSFAFDHLICPLSVEENVGLDIADLRLVNLGVHRQVSRLVQVEYRTGLR